MGPLTNLIDGGFNHKNFSKKSLEKIRKASTRRKHTEESKRKMSEAKKGIPRSEETIQKN